LRIVLTAKQKNYKYIKIINTLGVVQPAIQFFLLNALRVVQTAIHLEKFVLAVCPTRNVKNAKKNNNYGLYNPQ